ncbi:hypothetical protein GCM10029992_10620 [Glycomyces albus]
MGRTTEARGVRHGYSDDVTIYRSTDQGPVPVDGDPQPRRTSWRSAPQLAVRGGLIGAAEAVPGISGGTVALVVGLYDRLIDTAGQLVHAGRALVSGVVKRRGLAEGRRALAAMDWPLLVPVLVGMAVVLLLAIKTVAPSSNRIRCRCARCSSA